MKVLFSMRHLGSFRMYESVIRELAARGHDVHIVVDRGERLGWRKGLEQLLTDCPTVRWSWSLRQRRRLFWFEFSRIVRIWLDYLRYFHPRYDTTPILRRRAADLMPPVLVRITDRWPLGTPWGRGGLRRVLRLAERSLPRVRGIDESVRAEMPDVMLLTPLIYLASPQLEMLRSARGLGIRTALCVGSWDHLSSKAVIRDRPQRVLVWNETQQSEAVELHGVPPEQVVVTGAQCYDQWFGRHPSRDRAQFCRDVGVRPDRPFLLYVCSALFWGSPVEAQFVTEWVEALRSSAAAAFREIGIIIRPHPARAHEWDTIDLKRFDGVLLYGSNPIDHDSRNDYFDSLYYSAAIVGLNTSAFLEGAIVGRPVHTILPPQFHDNQEGTLHFRYLLTVGGGVLRAARDLDAHRAQLLQSIEHGADNRAFVQAFIRPHGLDRPATEAFVDAVEQLSREPRPQPAAEPLWIVALRPLFLPWALLAKLTSREIVREREHERHRRERERFVTRREQLRQRQKSAVVRARAAARARKEQARERRIAQAETATRVRQRERERAHAAKQRRRRREAWRQWIRHKLGLASRA